MSPLRIAATLLVAIFAAPTARAAPPDPLRFVPASAQVVVKVDHPRQLLQTVTRFSVFKEAQKVSPLKDLFGSTAYRRFYQLIAYLERESGAKWPELLDQAAGGGIALGFRFGPEAPAVLVIQGSDEKQSARVFDVLVQVLKEELERQESKDRITTGRHKHYRTIRIGDGLHAAQAGATIIISNKAEGLSAAMDLPASGGLTGGGPTGSVLEKKSLKDSRKLLGNDPLAWLWLDFASVKPDKGTKDFFDGARNGAGGMFVLGSMADCLRRSDFVAAGIYRHADGLRLAVRLPAGRSGLAPEYALHVPEKGKPGTLPLLEPPGVIYTHSMYLDIGYFSKHCEKFNDDLGRLINGLNKNSQYGEVLGLWGSYQRIVVMNQESLPYKKQPDRRLPAFGYVASMRDPKFGSSLSSIIRGVAFLASFQLGLKFSEVEHEGVKLTAYRYYEGKSPEGDPTGTRFNFEPCYAVVGDQFIAASTIEAGKKLITEVKRTAGLAPSAAISRGKVFATGVASLLKEQSDALVTDAILQSGVGTDEARKQVESLLAWAGTLGNARMEIDEIEKEYRFDLIWKMK